MHYNKSDNCDPQHSAAGLNSTFYAYYIPPSIVYLYETLKSDKDIIRAFDLCMFKNVSCIPVVGGLVTPDVLQELEEELEMVKQNA